MEYGSLPSCPKCELGVLLPFSGVHGQPGQPIIETRYSVWACSRCRYQVGPLLESDYPPRPKPIREDA